MAGKNKAKTVKKRTVIFSLSDSSIDLKAH